MNEHCSVKNILIDIGYKRSQVDLGVLSTCEVNVSGRRTTPSLNWFYSRLSLWKTSDQIPAKAKNISRIFGCWSKKMKKSKFLIFVTLNINTINTKNWNSSSQKYLKNLKYSFLNIWNLAANFRKTPISSVNPLTFGGFFCPSRQE